MFSLALCAVIFGWPGSVLNPPLVLTYSETPLKIAKPLKISSFDSKKLPTVPGARLTAPWEEPGETMGGLPQTIEGLAWPQEKEVGSNFQYTCSCDSPAATSAC